MNRMITRSESATDGPLVGASTGGTHRHEPEVRQHHSSPTPSSDLFRRGMILATTRVTKGTAVKIMVKCNGRTQTKRSRSTTVTMGNVRKIIVALSPRTRKVPRHGLHPRACLLSAALGREIHLYIRSSSSSNNSNNEIKPRFRVFGAGTAPWTGLACAHSMQQASRTR